MVWSECIDNCNKLARQYADKLASINPIWTIPNSKNSKENTQELLVGYKAYSQSYQKVVHYKNKLAKLDADAKLLSNKLVVGGYRKLEEKTLRNQKKLVNFEGLCYKN